MEENLKKPGFKFSYSGYQYRQLQRGYGVNSPRSGQAYVRCHFEGRLIDGTVFESTYKDEKPKEFRPIDVHDGWFATLLDMVEGDIFELVLPSELTKFGDEGGADGLVKGGDVVIYKLELVKISGKTRSALKCNITEPTKHCDKKEQNFIKKALTKSKEDLSKDLVRHTNMLDNNEMEPKIRNFTHRWIHILKQIIEQKKEEEKAVVEEEKKKQVIEEEKKEQAEFTCDIEKAAETCSAKEQKYISIVGTRLEPVLVKHLEVYSERVAKGQLEPDAEAWALRQMHILKQLITGEEQPKFFSFKHEF